MQTQPVRQRLSELHIEPVFLTGDQLRQSIANRESELKEIKVNAPPSLPPFEWIALGLAVVFGAVVIRESAQQKNRP